MLLTFVGAVASLRLTVIAEGGGGRVPNPPRGAGSVEALAEVVLPGGGGRVCGAAEEVGGGSGGMLEPMVIVSVESAGAHSVSMGGSCCWAGKELDVWAVPPTAAATAGTTGVPAAAAGAAAVAKPPAGAQAAALLVAGSSCRNNAPTHDGANPVVLASATPVAPPVDTPHAGGGGGKSNFLAEIGIGGAPGGRMGCGRLGTAGSASTLECMAPMRVCSGAAAAAALAAAASAAFLRGSIGFKAAFIASVSTGVCAGGPGSHPWGGSWWASCAGGSCAGSCWVSPGTGGASVSGRGWSGGGVGSGGGVSEGDREMGLRLGGGECLVACNTSNIQYESVRGGGGSPCLCPRIS